MSDNDRLAALLAELADEGWLLAGGGEVGDLASVMVAAGVTLAATPAPLALTPDLFSDLGEVLAAAVYETDGERYICRMCDSDVTTAPHSDDCEVKHLREWTFAANRSATPAPLDDADWPPPGVHRHGDGCGHLRPTPWSPR